MLLLMYMNSTITATEDIVSPILVYAILGIEFLNTIISAWTSYKLGHLEFKANHVSVCCCSIDNLDIEVNDNEKHKKKNNQKD